jgi:hypothetical protein
VTRVHVHVLQVLLVKPRHTQTTSRPLVKIKIVRMSNEKDMKELSKLLGGMNMPPGALALNFAVWTGRNEQDDASSNSFPTPQAGGCERPSDSSCERCF